MVKTYLDKVDVRIEQLMSKLSRRHDHDEEEEEEVGNRFLGHVKAKAEILTKYLEPGHGIPGFCKKGVTPVVYLPCYLLLRIRRRLRKLSKRIGRKLNVRGILSPGILANSSTFSRLGKRVT